MTAAAPAAPTKPDMFERCYALMQRNQRRYMQRKISWEHYDIWSERIQLAYGRQALRAREEAARPPVLGGAP